MRRGLLRARAWSCRCRRRPRAEDCRDPPRSRRRTRGWSSARLPVRPPPLAVGPIPATSAEYPAGLTDWEGRFIPAMLSLRRSPFRALVCRLSAGGRPRSSCSSVEKNQQRIRRLTHCAPGRRERGYERPTTSWDAPKTAAALLRPTLVPIAGVAAASAGTARARSPRALSGVGRITGAGRGR